jgi:phospholipid/cholesterol/gamma-HCH transport system substrate-binding protein
VNGERRTNAIVGGIALLLIFGGIYLLAIYLGGSFKSGNEVKADFARAGQLLRNGSDVKMRGVLVGSVSKIDITQETGKARVTMLIDPSQQIPENVNAAIRAKTLFGEKFIDLVPPDAPVGHLSAGDEIPESRTTPPIEVEQILEKGVPVLEAIDPEAFGASLHALAVAFTGNEDELRRATLNSEKLLTQTERTLPNLERNLVHLRHFASALNSTDTDLLAALDGLTAVGEVIRDNPEAFKRTVAGLVPLASDLGDILTARKTDLGDIAGEGAAVLKVVSDRADKLPGLVGVLDGFLSVWVKDLTPGPHWRISETDPAIVTGEPYGPGQAPTPAPSTALSAKIAGPDPVVRDLVGILFGPVRTPPKGTVSRLNPILATLTRGFGP